MIDTQSPDNPLAGLPALKTCPFCDADAKYIDGAYAEEPVCICCSDCGVYTESFPMGLHNEGYARVAAIWNRRATPPPAVEVETGVAQSMVITDTGCPTYDPRNYGLEQTAYLGPWIVMPYPEQPPRQEMSEDEAMQLWMPEFDGILGVFNREWFRRAYRALQAHAHIIPKKPKEGADADQ